MKRKESRLFQLWFHQIPCNVLNFTARLCNYAVHFFVADHSQRSEVDELVSQAEKIYQKILSNKPEEIRSKSQTVGFCKTPGVGLVSGHYL